MAYNSAIGEKYLPWEMILSHDYTTSSSFTRNDAPVERVLARHTMARPKNSLSIRAIRRLHCQICLEDAYLHAQGQNMIIKCEGEANYGHIVQWKLVFKERL